ncbi:MAG TPA: hypothetical protein PK322_00095 [Opitutaceae bacterium]|nr:hypothetical protein [Opitutaceae bacterium]
MSQPFHFALPRAQLLLELFGDSLLFLELLLELGLGLFLCRRADSFSQLAALGIGIGALLLHLLHAGLSLGEHRGIDRLALPVLLPVLVRGLVALFLLILAIPALLPLVATTKAAATLSATSPVSTAPTTAAAPGKADGRHKQGDGEQDKALR